MKKNLRLLLIIPVVIFFGSILIIFFSPVNILPCETSTTDPATSWDKSQCKGYYLTTNPPVSSPVVNVNNSAFLVNLVILICGSFLFNGVLFLILFPFVSLKQKPKKTELEKWDEVAALGDSSNVQVTPSKGLFTKMFKKEKPFEERFDEDKEEDINEDKSNL